MTALRNNTSRTRRTTAANRMCHCGECGRLIPVGTPVVQIRLPGVKRVLIRCEVCVAAVEKPDPRLPQGDR